MNSPAHCVNHNHHASKSCINCHLPLCEGCHRFDINSRPWCYSCGKDKAPNIRASLKGFVKTGLKIFCVLFAGLLVAAFVPGIYGWIGAMVGMTFVAKALFVRDRIGGGRVEEYRNGVCVRG